MMNILTKQLKSMYGKFYHRKRGFLLDEKDPVITSNHLLEEVTELQAEILQGNEETILNEAIDVYIVLAHLLNKLSIDTVALEVAALVQLDKAFTIHKDEILSNNPGFTRQNRND